jgi:hypothetical protein
MAMARTSEKIFQPKSSISQLWNAERNFICRWVWRGARLVARDDRRAGGLVAFAEIRAQPLDDIVRPLRAQDDGHQKCAQLLQRHAAHELALVGVRNHARFLGHDDDDRVRLLAQADGRAVARAERLVQILRCVSGKMHAA